MLSNKRPSFFKIILAGHSTEHLRIPPGFLKKISDEVTPTAVLKGPTGRYWHVEVISKNIGGVYLKSGWKEFLNDNFLGDNEFLIFRYHGSMRFDVKIFDKNGCERAYAFATATQQGSVVSNDKRKRGRPRKHPECNVHDRPVPCREPKELEIPNVRKIKTEETELNLMADSQLNDLEVKDFRRRNITEEKEMSVQMNLPSPKEVEVSVCEAAKAFTSPFPYFMISMRDYNVNRVQILSIPLAFSQTHISSETRVITLRNHEGRCWDVKVLSVGASRSLSGGWRAFVLANVLKQDDTCIFELVGKSEMQVHIFRATHMLPCTSALGHG